MATRPACKFSPKCLEIGNRIIWRKQHWTKLSVLIKMQIEGRGGKFFPISLRVPELIQTNDLSRIAWVWNMERRKIGNSYGISITIQIPRLNKRLYWKLSVVPRILYFWKSKTVITKIWKRKTLRIFMQNLKYRRNLKSNLNFVSF